MRIAVILASTGRPVELGRWTDHCARQTLQPVEIVYSVTSPRDVPENFNPPGARVVFGDKGLTRQRNAGLKALRADPDIVAFFDDDYVPSRHCFEGIARAFAAFPDIAGASGRLLADGILGPGIPFEEAQARIEAFDRDYRPVEPSRKRMFGTYGCNMAFRRSMLDGVEFDERLPLYGWQEDVDFSRRLLPRGPLIRTDAFTGVHQGSKSGRTSGVKLGYSQVANPIYLSRKGSLSWGFAGQLMLRNIVQNHLKSLRPEPWVDRPGRARGNWAAMFDLVRGHLDPGKIERL